MIQRNKIKLGKADEISEGAVDCALEEFLEHTLPDCLEVEDYRINGRFVNEQ